MKIAIQTSIEESFSNCKWFAGCRYRDGEDPRITPVRGDLEESMKLISSTLGYFQDSPYLKMERRRWIFRTRNKAMGFVKDKGVVAHDANVKTALFFGNKVADKPAGDKPPR
jgi:hypothetical protein